MRRIPFKKVTNLRDLGGYPTKDNKQTKYNRILRSNLPINMEEKEINYLIENNIKTIIDLRSKKEIELNKNDLDRKEFHYYNIPILGEKCPETEEKIPYQYLRMIDDYKNINKVLKTIAKSQEGVLFNCTAGKDRTGIIAMLILLLVNVYEEDIIADYAISSIYLQEKIKLMKKNHPSMVHFIGESKMEYIKETLKLFHDKYNNIDNYMKTIGITKEQQEQIKRKLLD